MTASYLVKRSDPARMAKAVITYQFVRPQFWIPMILLVAVFTVLGAQQYGAKGGIAGALLFAVIIGGMVLYKRRQLTSMLAARGYRPGSTLTADFGDGQVAIAADGGTAQHSYRDIADAKLLGDVVVLRLREARMLVALPNELVPGERLQALRAAP